MRSRFGCLTCKQRKLKCDEEKPICGQCSKAQRDCEYAVGAEFRHFEVPRTSPDNRCGEPMRDSVENHVWVDIPRELTFVQIEDPYEDDVFAELTLPPTIDVSSPPLAPNDSPIRQNGEIAGLSSPLFPSSLSGILDNGDSLSVDPGVLRAYLLWYFKQGPSQWMDLFDTYHYFSGKVSMLAATCPMLQSAACALSAKRISRQLSSPRSGRRTQLDLEHTHLTIPNWDKINWHYQIIQFYDEAIRQLKDALMPDAIDARFQNGEEFPEDILGVVAIMSMFELMDAPGVEWRAHLSALPLLNEVSQMTINLSNPLDHSRDHGRRSIFWSFARQDVISAFVHETQTFLNLDDRTLWNGFGLDTSDFGISMSKQELSHFSPPEIWREGSSPEESVSNAMTWILGRIINYITSGDSLNPLDFSRPTRRQAFFSVSQEALLERWCLLNTDLRRWYQSRPPTFNPSARSRITAADGCSSDVAAAFERTWYNVPMCAAAMQSYYMGRILLLMNRPQESTAIRSTVASRLKCYQDTERHVLNHSRQICGISLSMPPEAVRIHSLQPLYVAGQCFSRPHERQTVLDLLLGVERDLGWTVTYYVNKLREEWRRADEASDFAEHSSI